MNLYRTWGRFYLLGLCTVLCGPLTGQTATVAASVGLDPASTYHRFAIDNINLQNGNATIRIPLVSYPERDGQIMSFSFYTDTNKWTFQDYCQDNYPGVKCDQQYVEPGGYGMDPYALYIPPAAISWDQAVNTGWTDRKARSCHVVGGNDPSDPTLSCHNQFFRSVYLTDASGATRPLVSEQNVPYTMRTTDGSGYLVTFDQSDPNQPNTSMNVLSVKGPDGKPVGFGALDENGQPLYTLSGTTTTTVQDSVNRQIPWFASQPLTSSITGCPNLNLPDQQLVGSKPWSVPGPNGSTLNFIVCYASLYVRTNFWNMQLGVTYTPEQLGCSGADDDNCLTVGLWEQVGQENVVQSIVLPDGTSYRFRYDTADPNDSTSNGYGEIQEITYPAGGSVSYTYGIVQSACNYTGFYTPSFRYISSRTEKDGNGHSYVWTYSIDGSGTTTVTDPNLNDTVYTFSVPPLNGFCATSETARSIYEGSAKNNNRLQSISSSYSYAEAALPLSDYQDAPEPVLANVLLTERVTNTGGASVTERFTYDPPFQSVAEGNTSGAPLSLGMLSGHSASGPSVATYTESDFDWWTPGSVARQDNLLSRPSSSTVYDGLDSTSPVASATSFSYDESAYSDAGSGRGLVTSTKKSVGDGTSVITHTLWNAHLLQKGGIDANNNATSVLYDTSFSSIFPTTITNALGQTDTYTYDMNTGKVLSHQDVNKQTTSLQYDNYGRPWYETKPDVKSGAGVSILYCYPSPTAVTTVTASDTPLPVPTISTTCPANTGGGGISTTITDGLGRVIETMASSSLYSARQYDGLDHITTEWNPSLCDPLVASSCAAEPTWGSTTHTYDALGRLITTTNPDMTTTSHSYEGLSQTYTDEATHATTLSFDALHRLTDVFEDPSGLNLHTQYIYTALGDLSSVTQTGTGGEAARTRSFSYDQLSRLLTARNDETGTICYGSWSSHSKCQGGYDGNGNSTLVTDARGVQVSSAYDALNRIISQGHLTGSTLSLKCFQYDSTSAPGASSSGNFVGRLTNSWTQVGGAGSGCPLSPPTTGLLTLKSVLAYDPLGRPTQQKQCIYTACSNETTKFEFRQTYDLAGRSTSLTQVSIPGAVPPLLLQSAYDSFGRLKTVYSDWDGRAGSKTPLTLFSVQNYSPASRLQKWGLGDYLNLMETYDNRNRPTGMIVTHP